MAPARLSDDVLQHAAQLVAASNGNVTHAAIKAGMSRGTLQHQYRMAVAKGIKPDVAVVDVPSPPRPTDFDAAWSVLAAEIGMREDRYEGPCQRPRSDKVAVVSDIHAPFHESALLAQAFADTADADTLIIAGDVGDGFGWSRFTKYQTVPYEREIAAVAAIVQTASQRYRRVLISDGNHDGPRLEKQLRERLSPEMVEAILFMTGGTLSPIHALARRFENVEIVGHVTPDGQRMGWLYQHGDVLCAHAEKYSVVPVAALRKIEEWLTDMDQHLGLKPWRVLIQGHTHQGGVTPYRADKLLVESGCLAQQMGYQLGARIGGRPQRRGYVRFEQDAAGVTDINSIRFHWFDVDPRVKVA